MRWKIKPIPEVEKVDSLSRALNVEKPIAHLLVQRGIETFEDAHRFFRPKLEDLHDPYLLKDMDKAVARIEEAIENGENILVYGDYDVDGTTSVALVSEYLKTYYPNVFTYIPDRYDEGYGVSYQGIDFAHDNDFSLIITLDCGIKAVDKVAYASEKNIDFVICDHHTPGKEIPDAVAVLDPKREDCKYPYKELCGCGVGFKLIQALAARRGLGIEDLILYLDLVATAIAADIVPITGENRILAYYGLKVINENPRVGIQAILNIAKLEKLNVTDVVFGIAPRINAAGRMKHGQHAVDLLTETDIDTAREYALEIETFNTDRRETDRQITEEALQQIGHTLEVDRKTTVVYHESWHKGVIGIVASRLIETHYRPTLVFTKSGDRLVASARSVSGFDIYSALEDCADYIEQFGGHKYAAGLTLHEDNFEKFKDAFERVVSETIPSQLLTPEIKIDAEISLSDISSKFFRIIKQFGPFGPGNNNPIFMTKNLYDAGYSRSVGKDNTHLKLDIKQGDAVRFSGIGFGLGNKIDIVSSGRPFSAVYCLDENHWDGRTTIQLRVKDIRE
jgi:single-stranded-DNA-specific exonuclease